METSSFFLSARAWAFSVITLVSFVWITLLSIEAFTRWNLSGQPERAFLVAFILINFMTVFMLPILLILKFKAWLDGARMGLLLVTHIGAAAAYSYCFSSLHCASDDGDGNGICELVNLYTLMACWLNPLLLIVYAACLTLMVYRRRRRLMAEALEVTPDLEAMSSRGSTLPIMHPDEERRLTVNTIRMNYERKSSQPTLSSTIPTEKEKRTRSARLSKPIPTWMI